MPAVVVDTERVAPPEARQCRESVRVSVDLMERIRAIAKREGRMVSWVVDRLIESGMKAEGLQ